MRNKSISLNDYQYCAIQPYLSGNYQMDLLLRNHNWVAAVNTPVELSYKIVINPSLGDLYRGDYWSDDGFKLSLIIDYYRNFLPHIENDLAEYITDYI